MGKNLNRFFTKKDIWTTHKHMKKYSTSLVIREKQIQTNIGYHYTPTLWIKLKGHTQCWQRCAAIERCMWLVGASNDVLYKMHTYPMTQKSTLRDWSKRNENIKDLYKNVHNSYTYGSWKLERAQVSIRRRMNKQTVVYSYNKKLNYLAVKRNKPQIHTAAWIHPQNVLLNKSSNTQASVCYMSLFIWSSGTGKTNRSWNNIRTIVTFDDGKGRDLWKRDLGEFLVAMVIFYILIEAWAAGILRICAFYYM